MYAKTNICTNCPRKANPPFNNCFTAYVKGNHTQKCNTNNPSTHGITKCVNCHRVGHPTYGTCCGACAKNANTHTPLCDGKNKCLTHGCQRSLNFPYTHCCPDCMNGKAIHTSKCDTRNNITPVTSSFPGMGGTYAANKMNYSMLTKPVTSTISAVIGGPSAHAPSSAMISLKGGPVYIDIGNGLHITVCYIKKGTKTSSGNHQALQNSLSNFPKVGKAVYVDGGKWGKNSFYVNGALETLQKQIFKTIASVDSSIIDTSRYPTGLPPAHVDTKGNASVINNLNGRNIGYTLRFGAIF